MKMNHMAEQFKIKGKWLPSNKKSDMREEDHQGIIKALNALDNKQLECRSEGCEKEATAIIHAFPFCSDCGLIYLKSR